MGVAISYERGTPVGKLRQYTATLPVTGLGPAGGVLLMSSEALGQLGQDEPASGMALESLVAFAPISGSVAIALHHRNSDERGTPVIHRHPVSGRTVFKNPLQPHGEEPTRLEQPCHTVCRGTSPIRKRPPPQDPPRTLGICKQ